MFSTLLELLGFAALIAGTYLVSGLPAVLFLAGSGLILGGYALGEPPRLSRRQKAGRQKAG